MVNTVGCLGVRGVNLGHLGHLAHQQRVVTGKVKVSRAKLLTRHDPDKLSTLEGRTNYVLINFYCLQIIKIIKIIFLVNIGVGYYFVPCFLLAAQISHLPF